MSKLKPLAELGTAHRGDSCLEYPGEWLLFVGGKKQESFGSFEEAFTAGARWWEQASTMVAEPVKISICWSCSEGDPRVGQVWFTGFYKHGQFGPFGDYRLT